jgi:hypothetical protein
MELVSRKLQLHLIEHGVVSNVNTMIERRDNETFELSPLLGSSPHLKAKAQKRSHWVDYVWL